MSDVGKFLSLQKSQAFCVYEHQQDKIWRLKNHKDITHQLILQWKKTQKWINFQVQWKEPIDLGLSDEDSPLEDIRKGFRRKYVL